MIIFLYYVHFFSQEILAINNQCICGKIDAYVENIECGINRSDMMLMM